MSPESHTEVLTSKADEPQHRLTRFSRIAAGIQLLTRSKPALIGFLIILFWIVAALLAPLLAPYPPNANDPLALADPTPSMAHLLGTDQLGRDILSRILWGARRVLAIAPIAAFGAVVLGALLGVLAGYHRGVVDHIINRACDIVMTFPVIILYMMILANFGSSALIIVLILVVTKAPVVERIVRGMTLQIREKDYIAAAKMRGESAFYIMLVEILPNTRGVLLVDFCLRVGFCIVMIGVLGFLGIGLPPPDPDWGGMVKESYGLISVWPHMSLFPSLALSSLVIGFGLLANGLRELGLDT